MSKLLIRRNHQAELNQGRHGEEGGGGGGQ